ncbi:MAG: YciI family protein [Hyphomicrobiales bacterium]|nr:MAG: YciI family protein [Hyphomicrobiales bacterium]
MRFMIIVKNSGQTENVELPPEAYEEMGKFNQELIDAGVMLAGEGLTGSKDGAILTYRKGGKFEVKDGPFTEAKELIAGFWILQVKSREEAIEWAKRIPGYVDGETVEIRRVGEMSDFADVMTPEAMAKEEAMREQLARQTN